MTKFKKGTSGNPKGRPMGIPDRRVAYRGLIEQHVPELLEVVQKAALSGDLTACRLLLDKVVPSVRPREVTTTLPEFSGTLAARSEIILCAMAQGRLTPGEATNMLSALLAHSKVLETDKIVRRLDELEALIGEKHET